MHAESSSTRRSPPCRSRSRTPDDELRTASKRRRTGSIVQNSINLSQGISGDKERQLGSGLQEPPTSDPSGPVYAVSPDEKYVFKALNTTWIPPLVTTFPTITLRVDGRYGVADPLHLPQMFAPSQPHWALVPCKPNSSSHPAACLWKVPTNSDLQWHQSGATGVVSGETLIPEAREQLENAMSFIKSSIDRYYRMQAEEAPASAGPSMSDPGKHESTDPYESNADAQFHWQADQPQAVLQELRILEERVDYAWSLLTVSPTLERIILQWAHLHRCWVECWAWVQWHSTQRTQPPRATPAVQQGLDGAGVMGAFCADPEQARQLVELGIPVWLIDHATSYDLATLQRVNPEIQREVPMLSGGMPSLTLTCRAGEEQFRKLCELSQRATTWTRTVTILGPNGLPPPPLVSTQISYELKSAGSARDHFESTTEKRHPCVPPRISVWQDALVHIDITAPHPDRVARSQLWLPDVDTVIGVQNPLRVFVQAANWMSFRARIQRLLAGGETYAALKTPTWRVMCDRFPRNPAKVSSSEKPVVAGDPIVAPDAAAVSGGSRPEPSLNPAQPSRSKLPKKRLDKLAALAELSRLLGEEVPEFPPYVDALTWRGTTLSRTQFENQLENGQLPDVVVKNISELAWELSEMSFRVDLYQADIKLRPDDPKSHPYDSHIQRTMRIARVVGDGHGLIPTLPPQPVGLRAPDVRQRAPSLEAFRQLLLEWRPAPRWLCDPLSVKMDPRELLSAEQTIVRYYCQRFFEAMGRFPSVPRS